MINGWTRLTNDIEHNTTADVSDIITMDTVNYLLSRVSAEDARALTHYWHEGMTLKASAQMQGVSYYHLQGLRSKLSRIGALDAGLRNLRKIRGQQHD